MERAEVILGAPHNVQHVMSSKRIPVLCGTIYAFEMFMTRWEDMKKAPHMGDLIQPGLDWAYGYYSCMDHTRAYVIAMRKCLCLPALGNSLIVICSCTSLNTFVMDSQALGTTFH